MTKSRAWEFPKFIVSETRGLCLQGLGIPFFNLMTLLVLVGCSASPPPTVTELVSIKPPTFDGKLEKIFVTPAQTFTLQGECDPLTHLLEYSLDSEPYKTVEGACPTGRFSITVGLVREREVRVRAKGRFDYAKSVAHAVIRFTPPPTSPYLSLVQSSASDSSDFAGRGTQNTMSLNFSGGDSNSRWFKLQRDLLGIVYGSQ